MKFGYGLTLFAAILSCGLQVCAGTTDSNNGNVIAQYMGSPIGFQENRGQAGQGFTYVSRGLRHNLGFTRTGFDLAIAGKDAKGTNDGVAMRFINPSSSLSVETADPLPSRSNYFIGRDSSKWIQGLQNYKKLQYSQVWPGIDVVFYGTQSQLEYDVILKPGVDLQRVKFSLTGAKALQINAAGDLLITTESGDMIQRRPVAYQPTASGRKEVAVRYAVKGNLVSFIAANYDHSAPLVVDPLIAFSVPRVFQGTFDGTAVKVDNSGHVFIGGTTLPALNSAKTASYVGAFVVQLDYQGNVLNEQALGASDGNVVETGMAIDNNGSVYITGYTNSVNGLAIKNPYQSTSGGATDGVIARFGFTPTTTTLMYSSYLGGNGNDLANAVAADSSGDAYVAGQTASTTFPHTIGNSYAGGYDVFLMKINTNAVGPSSLTFSYLAGGSGDDAAESIALDANYAYLAGYTFSTNFSPNPTFGFSTSKTSSTQDGFVLKINAGNTSASYFTFLPNAPIAGIAIDGSSQAYVTGSSSGSIPTNSVNMGYAASFGAGHAYLARLDTGASGSTSLVYSTYLAGGSADYGFGVVADNSGNAIVVGDTNSSNFPVAGNPLQSTLPATCTTSGVHCFSGFVSKVNTNASGSSSLVYSSYLGGSGNDEAFGVALTAYGNPVITGQTSSPNFPVTPGYPQDGRSDARAFATKIAFESAPIGSLDLPTNNTTNAAGAIRVTGWALSPIGISRVSMWRDPVPGETPAGNGYIYLADAPQVPGVRPDVAAAFPSYPNNNWGWGAQVLTNELPGTGGKPLGNGTYRFHVIATDNDGLSSEIGAATVSVNNASSVLPFGTIDTPSPGGSASGSAFYNYGWALTAQPNIIPTDGSTITVYIDNVAVGHPVYNNYRPDVSTLFPGLRNSAGPVAYYIIDTTKLSNGLHSISWNVTDSGGNTAGLGSRNFFVQN